MFCDRKKKTRYVLDYILFHDYHYFYYKISVQRRQILKM